MPDLGAILTGAMNLADYDRVRRWRKSAETWASKAAALLRHEHERAPADVRPAIEWEASCLFGRLLDAAYSLAKIVPLEDALVDAEREATELVAVLRRRRLAERLSDTAGRTPEEAALFELKAAELRG